MPGTAIGTDLTLGYAGKVSRNPDNLIRNRFVKSILDGDGIETLSAVPFGFAVVLNTDNTYSKFGQAGSGVTAAAAAAFAGVAVSEVKQSMSYSYGANDAAGQYEPGTPADVLQKGKVPVFCNEGTPTAGGAVYIMTVAGTNAAIGEFVATSTPDGDGATAVELPNCKWTTGKQDSSGITEMSILYPVTA
jgi:hypothetical protein